MVMEAQREPASAVPPTALGRFDAGGTHNSAACRTGAWEYDVLYPLRAIGEAA